MSAEENQKVLRGSVWGGLGGALGGFGFTGAVIAGAVVAPGVGVAVGLASVLSYIALCVGIVRRVGGRRQTELARAVDAAVQDGGGGPQRALPAPRDPSGPDEGG